MIRTPLALALLVLAAPAFADDQQAANECIAAWGSKSPFKVGKKPDLIIGTGVKVFGLGKGQTNDASTAKPSLVVVHPAVNVAGKSTIRLSNPNGWYCFESAVTVFVRFPPASISACVTVREHVYTHVSVVSSLLLEFVSPVGPLIAELHFGSATVTPVNVTLPVFVTVNLYGTT